MWQPKTRLMRFHDCDVEISTALLGHRDLELLKSHFLPHAVANSNMTNS